MRQHARNTRVLIAGLTVAAVSATGMTAAAAAGASTSPAQLGPAFLDLAHTTAVSFAPMQLALQDGALQKAPDPFHTKLKVTMFETSPPQTAGLSSGSLDIGEYGPPPAAGLVATGVPVKFMMMSGTENTDEGLAVKNGITSVRDLIGKKIAAPLGTSSDFMVHGLLAYYGISTSQVTVLNLEPAAMQAAWSRGDIQAAYIWNPYLSDLVAAGGKELTWDGQLMKESKGKYNGGWNVYAVRTAFEAKYPAVVRAVVNAVNVATTYINQNPVAAAEKLHNGLAINESTLAIAFKGGISFPTAAQSASSTWLGAPGHPGGFVTALLGVWQYLYARKSVLEPPSSRAIASYIDADFLP